MVKTIRCGKVVEIRLKDRLTEAEKELTGGNCVGEVEEVEVEEEHCSG